MTLLVLRTAVVAGTGKACGGRLIDFGEVEGEIGSDVWVEAIDSAVEDGDANACSHGGVPWAVDWATGDACAEPSGLKDSPLLRRRRVVGVVRGGGADGDSEVAREDGAEDEGVSGKDTVVDDVVNRRVGAQGGEGGYFVGVGGGVENSDAEGSVAAKDVHACKACSGLDVDGENAVAVGDQIAMRDGGTKGAGRLLGTRAQGGDEEEADQDECGDDEKLADGRE